MGFSFQVDFDHLISRLGICFVIAAQVWFDRVGHVGKFLAVGSFEIARHGLIIGKYGSSSSNLRSHVTNGTFTRTREALNQGQSIQLPHLYPL